MRPDPRKQKITIVQTAKLDPFENRAMVRAPMVRVARKMDSLLTVFVMPQSAVYSAQRDRQPTSVAFLK